MQYGEAKTLVQPHRSGIRSRNGERNVMTARGGESAHRSFDQVLAQVIATRFRMRTDLRNMSDAVTDDARQAGCHQASAACFDGEEA